MLSPSPRTQAEMVLPAAAPGTPRPPGRPTAASPSQHQQHRQPSYQHRQQCYQQCYQHRQQRYPDRDDWTGCDSVSSRNPFHRALWDEGSGDRCFSDSCGCYQYHRHLHHHHRHPLSQRGWQEDVLQQRAVPWLRHARFGECTCTPPSRHGTPHPVTPGSVSAHVPPVTVPPTPSRCDVILCNKMSYDAIRCHTMQ